MATTEESEMLELCEAELDDFKAPDDLSSPEVPPKHEAKEAKEPQSKPLVLDKDKESTSLYESMGIDLKDPKIASHTRLDTLYVHGLNDMSSQDLYKFFEPLKPIALEWIDDSACNVVWHDEESAAQALLKFSHPSEENTANKDVSEDQEKSVKDSNEIVMIDEDEDDEGGSEDGELPEPKEDKEKAKEKKEEDKEKKFIWRTAQIPNMNQLKMRFATLDDRKIRGAEKFSEYYKKHGNPNFGGLKGLISNSRKRKFRQNTPLVDYSDLDLDPSPDHQNVEDARHRISQITSEKSEKRETLPKTRKMKMYADEEEETIQRQKSSKISNRLGSITVNFSLDREEEEAEEEEIEEDEDDYDELEVSSPQEFGSKSVWDRLQVEVPNTRYSYGEEKKRSRTSDHKTNDYHSRRDLRKKLQRIRDHKKDHRSPLLVGASTK